MWNRSILVSCAMVALLSSGSASQAWMAPDSFFDVFLESASGPAFPTSPTQTWVQNQLAESGPLVTTAEIDLSLGAASSGTGVTTLTMSDAVPNKAIGDIKLAYMAPDSFFDVFLECYNPSHGALPIIGTPVVTPNYMAPDSFFDVFLECVGPTPGTTQAFNMHCAMAEGLTFSDVGIQNLSGVAGEFDVIGQVSVLEGYSFTPGSSAMTITVTGGVVPEPSTLILLAIGALGLAAHRWHRR